MWSDVAKACFSPSSIGRMSDSPPDAATIEKARQLNVLDAEGKQVSFGSLIEDAEKDTIVVFIR